MTTRTYIGRLALPLVTACLALGLPAGAAHANFMIPPFDVTEDGLSAAPNVAVQSDGTAHFMWTQSPSELQTRERGPDGSLGQIKTVAPTPTGGSQLAVDGAGNVHFVWKGQSQKRRQHHCSDPPPRGGRNARRDEGPVGGRPERI